MKKKFLSMLHELRRGFTTTSIHNQQFFVFAFKLGDSYRWTYPLVLSAEFSPIQIEWYLRLLEREGEIETHTDNQPGADFRGVRFVAHEKNEQVSQF